MIIIALKRLILKSNDNTTKEEQEMAKEFIEDVDYSIKSEALVLEDKPKSIKEKFNKIMEKEQTRLNIIFISTIISVSVVYMCYTIDCLIGAVTISLIDIALIGITLYYSNKENEKILAEKNLNSL